MLSPRLTLGSVRPQPPSPLAAARVTGGFGEARPQDEGESRRISRPGGSAGRPGPRAEWALSPSVTNASLVCRFVCGLSPPGCFCSASPPAGLIPGQAPPRGWASRTFGTLLTSPQAQGGPRGYKRKGDLPPLKTSLRRQPRPPTEREQLGLWEAPCWWAP